MREIKFRAWDEEEKVMIQWEALRIEKDTDDPKISVVIFDGPEGSYFDDFQLLQYTGLKDKNGVEIYEGDILEYYDLRKGVLIFKKQPKRRAAIRWSQNDAQYRIPDMGFRIDTDKVEVVGNIYEDGHLVEGEENASGR